MWYTYSPFCLDFTNYTLQAVNAESFLKGSDTLNIVRIALGLFKQKHKHNYEVVIHA